MFRHHGGSRTTRQKTQDSKHHARLNPAQARSHLQLRQRSATSTPTVPLSWYKREDTPNITMGLFRKKKPRESASDEAATTPLSQAQRISPQQAVELGTIRYVNLTADGRHGDMDIALQVAAETRKPLFCNFVEWSG